MAKKILAVVLAVMMAVSAMAVTAFADTTIDLYNVRTVSDGGDIIYYPGSDTYDYKNWTVTFDIPIYSLFGYTTSDYYVEFKLPQNFVNAPQSNDINWSIIVNGNAYTLNKGDASKTDPMTARVYFGAFGHNYTDGYWTTVPQSTTYGDITSMRLVATVSTKSWGGINANVWASWDGNAKNYKAQLVDRATDEPVTNSTTFIYDWNPKVTEDAAGTHTGKYTFVTAAWDNSWLGTLGENTLYGLQLGEWWNYKDGNPISFDHTLANKNTLANAVNGAKLVIETDNPLNGQAIYTLWATNDQYSRGTNWWQFNGNRTYVSEYRLDGKSSKLEFDVPADVLYDPNYGTLVQQFVIFENITLFNNTIMKNYLRYNGNQAGNSWYNLGTLGRLSWDSWRDNVKFDGDLVRYADGGITSIENFGTTDATTTQVERLKVVYAKDAEGNKIKVEEGTVTLPKYVTVSDTDLEVVINEDGTYKTEGVDEYYYSLVNVAVTATKEVPVLDEDGNQMYYTDKDGKRQPVYTVVEDPSAPAVKQYKTITTAGELKGNDNYAGVGNSWNDETNLGNKTPAKALKMYLLIEEPEEEQTKVENPQEEGQTGEESEEVGETPEVSAPEEEEPAETTPEVTAPETEEKNPGTGIALAVLPMILSAAAAVISKKH